MASSVPKAQEPRYFYEDEVFRFRRGGIQFGMVVENSEFLSSDESGDEDDRRLRQGHVRVAWHPKGHEEVIKEGKIGLTDRSLMPGDVVRRLIRGRDTQRGYCKEIDVNASVQIIGTNMVIFCANSRDLIPLEEMSVDIAVCFNSWVGMVRHIKSRIKVKFRDGSICYLDDTDAEDLEDVNDERDEDCEFKRYDFYPGQVLKGPLSVFENGEFEFCTEELKNIRNSGKDSKQVKVTVEKSEVVSLGVQWQCQACSTNSLGLSEVQPPHQITGEDLKKVKMLNVFEPCTLQIGDRNYYTLKENDLIISLDEWRSLEKNMIKDGENEFKVPRLPQRTVNKKEHFNKEEDACNNQNGPSDSLCCKNSESALCAASSSSSTMSSQTNVHKKRSKLSRESESSIGRPTNAPTVTSSAIRHFSIKKKKKLRRSRKSVHEQQVSIHGPAVHGEVNVNPGDRLVVETLVTKSLATVVWQDGTVEEKIPSHQLFPIHALDEQEFFPGDCVVRCPESEESVDPHLYGVVQSVDHTGRTCKVQWFRTYTVGNEPKPQKLTMTEEPVYDLRDHPDFKYRPGSVIIRVANFPEPSPTENEASPKEIVGYGGQVLDYCISGEVSVWWADGSVSLCWPQDLYKIGEYDSDDGELWDDDDDEEDGSSVDGEDGSYTSDGSWETESAKSINDDDGGSMEDDSTLKQRLASNVDKARKALKKVEDNLSDHSSIQSTTLMKQLLDVLKDGKELDGLLGTSFFDDSKFEGLIEKIHERCGVVSGHHQAMQEQVHRLFSSSDANTPDVNDVKASENTNEIHSEEQTKEIEAKSQDDLSTKMICLQLCLKIQDQLVKSHDEVMMRHGGQAGAFSPEDIALAPGEEDQDLEGIMNQVFKISMGHFQRHLSSIFPNLLGTYQMVATTDDPSVTVAESTNPEVETTEDHETPSKIKGNVSAQDISTTLYGTPDDQKTLATSNKSEEAGEFSMLEFTPQEHKFKLSVFQPTDPKNFIKFLRKEIQLLRTSLPQGINIKGFEDRMDLFSVMIKGPEKTPYEDGIFFFDMQLPPDYPKAPPIVHYHSYCSDRLNPNLYEDGKVCVSLLGTWSGKGTETWTPNSNLLQLLVSIQGLILVSEPYFNEAGYERQKGTQQGIENSRMYNEMVLLKLVQSLTKMAFKPPETFEREIRIHFTNQAARLLQRLESWRLQSLHISNGASNSPSTPEGFVYPDFPLVPASKGFCISLGKALEGFRDAINLMSLSQD